MPAIGRTAALLLLYTLAGCQDRAPAGAGAPASDSATAWTFEPGVSFGAIGAASSERDLVAAYGAQPVRPAEVPLGEGETVPGTEVFGDDPLQRFLVTWKDTLARRMPDHIQLMGDSTRWRGLRGVTLGVSLRQLERMNGRPFTLLGFGWDYGGTVSSWEGGELAPLEGSAIVTLTPHPDAQSGAAFQSVLGDRPFSSAQEEMQELNPRVRRLVLRFQ